MLICYAVKQHNRFTQQINTRVSPQMPSQTIQSLSQASWTWPTDSQTDRTCYSVCSNSPPTYHANDAMQVMCPKNGSRDPNRTLFRGGLSSTVYELQQSTWKNW